MNDTTSLPRLPSSPTSPRTSNEASPSTVDAMHARFGLRVAARLSERAAELEPDLSERLRFAREKALERARQTRRDTVRQTGRAATRPVVGSSAGGAALLGALSGGQGWWVKVASVFPAVALALGLFMIQRSQDNAEISTAAEVDAALLADDLPPQAYSDAGFAEYLKSSNE